MLCFLATKFQRFNSQCGSFMVCAPLLTQVFPEPDDQPLFGLGGEYRQRAQDVLAVWQGVYQQIADHQAGLRILRSVFSKTIFFVESPDFFADFVAVFFFVFLFIFVGRSAQKILPPGKSPAKCSKTLQQQSSTHFCRGASPKIRTEKQPKGKVLGQDIPGTSGTQTSGYPGQKLNVSGLFLLC